MKVRIELSDFQVQALLKYLEIGEYDKFTGYGLTPHEKLSLGKITEYLKGVRDGVEVG